MENFKTPEQIVQEMIGDQAERIDFNKGAEEVIEKLKRDFFPNYVRAIHVLQNAEDVTWSGKYAEKIDEVVEMCLGQYGIDPRNVPEYYFELDEAIKKSQQVIDFLHPDLEYDLQSAIEQGSFKFPSLQSKERIESEGYTLPIFTLGGGIQRGSFISCLDNAYKAIMGSSLIPTNALTTFLEKDKKMLETSLIFVKPNLEMDEDEEMRETLGNTYGIMQNRMHRSTKLNRLGFELEEYMYFQTHNYLNSGSFADRKYWMSLAGEGFFINKIGDNQKTACLQANGVPFDFAKLYGDDKNIGTRLLYKAR